MLFQAQTREAKSIWAYGAVFLAFWFLFGLGEFYEPFGLALLFACLSARLSPLTVLFFFLVSPLLNGVFQPVLLLLYAAEAALTGLGFVFYRRFTERRQYFFSFFCLTLALAVFVGFAPFSGYDLPFGFSLGATMQKTLIAALIFLLSAAFTVALKGITRKLLRCRLRADEIIFSLLLFLFSAAGCCRVFGLDAYMGGAFFILAVFAYVTKDGLGTLCAFVLAVPAAIIGGISPERFFLYGIAVVLVSRYGKLAEVCALLIVYFIYGYFDGLYNFATGALVRALLCPLLPCLAFLLLPSSILHRLEDELIFYREKHLSRIAINRNRAAIGEQLFEISGVFREIQTTFSALGDTQAEDGAKEYIRGCVIEQVCKKCPQYAECLRREGGRGSLNTLIDVGCMKGRVSLIDIPSAMAKVCVRQSDVLYSVNRQIGDFRKYMLETENAANGRSLLANQAQGISEILRNIALEQSEPLKIHQDQERALNVAMLKAGVVCSEVLIFGEDRDITLSLVTFGAASVKKIADVAGEFFGVEMIISKRLALSKDKFCCILRKKPLFDAAFGVAAATKFGESASGDTHSVIKIDERRFMVALSDGMGSGEYARKISESTISLLESFYRAKMPSPLILSTVNKLLSFNREESFACVDIAVVDLDSGMADIVKIGSPFGFILSGNTMKILESASLPLGVLESLHPDVSSYPLQENDVLLFLSDGITDAFGSSADLYEVLKRIPATNPQEMANSLLEKAIAAYGNVAKDDMTVLAVRLFKSA